MQQMLTQYQVDTSRATSSSFTTELQPGAFPKLKGATYGFGAPKAIQGIPSAFIHLDPIYNSYVIVVEKLHHRLSLFKAMPDAPPELVKTFRAVTGKDPRDKKVSGDLRSPEGIYMLNSKIHDRDLPPKYGRMAFVSDYPNLYDQLARKTGYGIWLHATDNPKRLQIPFDTEGCVAVSNEDITDLQNYIELRRTPIVITKEMSTAKPQQLAQAKTQVLALIEDWRNAWESKDITRYMTHYSQHFRSKRMNKRQWQRYKKRVARYSKDIQVNLDAFQVMAYEGQLVVQFQQIYKSNVLRDVGHKTLYLKWQSGRYQIIAEKWQKWNPNRTSLARANSSNPDRNL